MASVDPRDIADVASALLLMPDPAPHYSKKYMLTGPKDENDQRYNPVIRFNLLIAYSALVPLLVKYCKPT